ncbi:hypothetical protein M758_UG006900 [Ceratodon purpureus]|nr:hypothetical protein M758_UG006900 [Ceratodon purpureus]
MHQPSITSHPSLLAVEHRNLPPNQGSTITEPPPNACSTRSSLQPAAPSKTPRKHQTTSSRTANQLPPNKRRTLQPLANSLQPPNHFNHQAVIYLLLNFRILPSLRPWLQPFHQAGNPQPLLHKSPHNLQQEGKIENSTATKAPSPFENLGSIQVRQNSPQPPTVTAGSSLLTTATAQAP